MFLKLKKKNCIQSTKQKLQLYNYKYLITNILVNLKKWYIITLGQIITNICGY